MTATLEDEARALQRRIRAIDPSAPSDAVTDLILKFLQEIRSAAIDEAAALADPPLLHRKGGLGLWRIRRIEIAERIRSLKPPG